MTDYKTHEEARAEAQRLSNQDGYDRGLRFNPIFKTYYVFGLPQAQNRYGASERDCEVVSCTDLAKCKPGHGPMAKMR
jgi:hypothetical protein